MDCRRGTVGTGEAFSFPVERDATQPTEKEYSTRSMDYDLTTRIKIKADFFSRMQVEFEKICFMAIYQ